MSGYTYMIWFTYQQLRNASTSASLFTPFKQTMDMFDINNVNSLIKVLDSVDTDSIPEQFYNGAGPLVKKGQIEKAVLTRLAA